MFLSNPVLNPKSREARRDLANPYDLHRTLARAFAPDEQTAPGRFLWRLEPGQLATATAVGAVANRR